MKYKATPPPGTVADLVMRYRRSPRVLAWAPSTAAKFDKILGRFMAANRLVMVADIRRGDILAARDDLAATPGEANNWLKVIRGLFDYGADIELIPFNPARGIKRLKPANPDGFRSWREDEITAYLAHWPRVSLQHLVFALALYTGAARSDLVRLGWQSVEEDRIVYRRQKTGVAVSVPILPPLAAVLALVPRSRLTFLETESGLVRSDKALGMAFMDWCEKAGLGGKIGGHYLSLHGLRKALGRRLADAGCTETEIMAVLGHTDSKQVRIYTHGKDMARAADSAMGKMANNSPGPTRIVRLETRGKSK